MLVFSGGWGGVGWGGFGGMGASMQLTSLKLLNHKVREDVIMRYCFIDIKCGVFTTRRSVKEVNESIFSFYMLITEPWKYFVRLMED